MLLHDLSSEINDGEGTESQIRQQYQKDWNEWPATDGAPFKDVDGDGSYNPSTDIPGVPGSRCNHILSLLMILTAQKLKSYMVHLRLVWNCM